MAAPGIHVIAPSLIRRLHGKPAGQFAAFRIWGDRIDMPLYTIDELSVGGRARQNVVVGSRDLLDTLHLDGIESLNDFRQQPVTFASKNAGGASGVRYVTTVSQWSLAPSPPVTTSHPRVTLANIIYDCVSDLDFWAGRAVTFDIPGRALIVSP